MNKSQKTKIVLAMVDETGIRATGRYRDRLQQVAEVETFPEARAAVWSDYTVPRLDQLKRHIEQERPSHLWMGYFLLPDTSDILSVARAKALSSSSGV